MRALLVLIVAVTGLAAAQTPGRGSAPQPPPKAASSAVQNPPSPVGHADHGKAIYAAYGCYECHNYAANGGAAGPRLAPRPLAFEQFSKYVRKPSGEMPPYTRKVVSDADLADIYAYLLTIPAPPAPAKNAGGED